MRHSARNVYFPAGTCGTSGSCANGLDAEEFCPEIFCAVPNKEALEAGPVTAFVFAGLTVLAEEADPIFRIFRLVGFVSVIPLTGLGELGV